MKRLWLYIGAGFLALVILIFLGLIWLIDTSSGARFAVTTLSGLAGVRVTAQGVEGRLRDRLRLTGLRLVQPKLVVQVERLDLSWEPDRLLAGKLLVHEFGLTGVRIQDDTPLSAKAPDLRWPRVSEPVRRMDARVERFSVQGLTYRHLQGEPAVLSELSGGLALQDGLLSLSAGSLSASRGKVSGELVAGLWRPSLKLDLRLAPSEPVAEMDTFSVQARLQPGKDPEQLAGPVAVAGRRGGAQRLELNSELGITRTGFNFRSLRLVRPGRTGTLTGKGSMTLTKSEPLFSLALQAADLDLGKELKHPARLSGTLTFSGTPSNYLGKFSLANKGPGWQTAALSADYRGGKSGIKLAPLSGRVLQGSVRGALQIAWSEGLRVSGNLAGRNLDPAQLVADWQGVVNLDLAGVLQVPQKGEMRGALQAKILESRLQGRALRGELDGSFAGERVAIKRLFLAGNGFQMRGAGELDRRFNFAANVSDLSGLVPGTAGELQADGWLRWRDGMLSGAASGKGRNIAAAGTRVGALQLEASLGEGKDHPVALKASLTALRVGEFQVETALLALRGTAKRHTLEAELASRGVHAEALLSGGYADGVWRGELARLSGADQVGPFALAAPAALLVSADRFSLSPLVINGLPGERLELAGNLNRDRSGAFRGGWTGVNLARANLWLAAGELTGTSSGDFNMRVASGGRVTVSARAEASGAVVSEGNRVTLERFLATVQGDSGGLDARIDLALEKGAGTARLDFHSDQPARLALPERGDLTLQWADLDLALLRPLLSPELVLDGRLAGQVNGRLSPGRKVELRGNTALTQGHLNWHAKGDDFDATLDRAELSFQWRGGAAGKGGGRGGELTLNGRADATGLYRSQGQKVAGSQFTLRVDADRQGTRGAVELWLDTGGSVRAALSSDAPAGTAIPETGDISLEWSGIKPTLLRPWLPGTIELQGELYGEAKGRLMPGQRLELAGQAGFSQGSARWQGGNGEVSAKLRSATLGFAWRGETLTGDLSLALAEYGQAQGNFRLPIPARLPVTPNPSGKVQGALTGKLQERGFLTVFFPGLLQESHGMLDVDLRLGGVWGDPTLVGSLQLADAGAYLPSAGITLTGVQLSAQLRHDEIRIERLRALSGGGELVGNLLMRLKGWEVQGYTGSLNGQRFQAVYLPELRMFASPQLSFEGDAKRVTLKGEVGIPEMLISGPPVRQIVTPSADVVFEGAPPRVKEARFPLLLEGRVKIVLGDNVRVDASGIDAKLGGSMDLVLNGIDNIESSGEIKVVQGRYRAYGMDLKIERGRLYYVNDPVNRPSLDVLALRTVGDVKAGVTVAGSLNAPVVKLYSEPTMPEVDILAYMVLGHPLGASGEQGSMVATAAASLFSFGKSESMQEQIKNRLGLSTLGLESVKTTTTGRMGYKEIATTPAGAASAAEPAAESVFTVGKYLTPGLYLSYGRSLVTGQNLFRLRYDLFKRWQIETQSGSESGADLYYKLEFN